MRISVQQAAANAYATWLSSKLTDVTVEPQWPAPDRTPANKSITLVTAGRRKDSPIDLRLLKSTNVGSYQATSVWQLAACTQPFQLDIWTLNDVDRDDIIARLDEIFHLGESSLTGIYNPSPVGTGNLIAVQDGWESCGTIADFIFEEPDLEMTTDLVGRGIYRASYSGDAHFMLTVTSTTARQITQNFQLRLDETDATTAFP